MDRKFWIDNLRWITIVIVVIFHCFFYYNNIGTAPMFERLSANPQVEGQKAACTVAGIFQYGVYQWFMLLLFVVSGMCAKYTLQNRSLKEFMKMRTQKLLVPSTLGVLAFQWLGGWIITSKFSGNPTPADSAVSEAAQQIPEFVNVLIRYGISVLCGIGALWFCHVLFVACCVFAIIKLCDKKNRFEEFTGKSNVFVACAIVALMIGAARIFNFQKIPTYRFGYDVLAFLSGYYIVSSKKVLAQLKKFGWICLLIGIGFGIWYFIKFYGMPYSNLEVQNDWVSIVHAWFTMLGILGIAQNILEFNSKFSRYMSKASWGIYVNHILVLLALNAWLTPFAPKIPVALIYLLEFVVSLPASIALWELFRRIPVVRYLVYGIKK